MREASLRKRGGRLLAALLALATALALTSGAAFAVAEGQSAGTVLGAQAESYAITVTVPANGTITVGDNLESAAEGTPVAFTVAAAEGYKAATPTVVNGETAVEVTKTGDGGYSFTMPAGAVTIGCSFWTTVSADEVFGDIGDIDKYETHQDRYKAMLERVKGLNADDYSADSYAVMTSRLTEYDQSMGYQYMNWKKPYTDQEFDRLCEGLEYCVSLLRTPGHAYYDELAGMIEQYDAVDPAGYTEESYQKFSEQYASVKANYPLENARSQTAVDLYKNYIEGQYRQCFALLVPKGESLQVKEDKATGVSVSSEYNVIPADSRLVVEYYDGENWVWDDPEIDGTLAKYTFQRVPATCSQYAYYAFALYDAGGKRIDMAAPYTVTIQVPEAFDMDELQTDTVKNSCARGSIASIAKDADARTVTLVFRNSGFLYDANGAGALLKNPASGIDPAALKENGVYEIQANLLKAGDTSTSSMANNALKHSAYLVKNGDDIDVYLHFGPMTVMGKEAYCGGLWSENGKDDGEVYADSQTVYSYYTNEDGSIRDNDIYNGITELNCIKDIKVHLERDCYDSGKKSYLMAIMSPTMAAMQNMSFEDLKTHWDDLTCNLVISNASYLGTMDMMQSSLPSYDASALRWQIDYAKSLDGELYTGDSYAALTGRLEAAQAVYEDSASASADYEAQIAEVKAAIDGLRIDPTKLGDTEAFAAYLDGVEGTYDSRKYTKSTYEGLADAIAAARRYIGKENVTQRQLDEQRENVEGAIKGLKAKSASQLDVADLPDGEYTVDIAMKKAAQIRADSMSKAAVEHTIKLEVRGGRYYATLDFKGLTISLGGQDLFGHLGRLTQYVDGCTVDAETGNILDADGRQVNNLGQAEKTAYLTGTEVLSTQGNADGTDVVDCFNDGSESALLEGLYPDEVRFEVIKSVLGDEETTYAPLHVFVPVMESTGVGVGEQDVLMRIDWTSLALGYDAVEDAKAVETARNELSRTVADAKGISNNKGAYTAASYKKLTDAIAEAEALVRGGTATAAELKAANAKIAAARKALVKASEMPAKPAAPKVARNKTYRVSGQSYKVTKVAKGKVRGTVTFTKAKNAKVVTVPKSVKLADRKVYKVTAVGAKAFTGKKVRTVTVGANVSKLTGNAFAKSRATRVVLKTRKLKKASVRGCLKGSKVKTVKVPKAKRRAYGRIFTERVAGRRVTVK